LYCVSLLTFGTKLVVGRKCTGSIGIEIVYRRLYIAVDDVDLLMMVV